MSASPAALAQGNGWTISEASGPVTIQDAAGKHAAKRGTPVAEGATVATGAGGRVVVVRGKDFMTVNANSRVRIPQATAQRGVVDVLQDWGNAIFQIEKKPNPHFGVRTPYLAAVVKGTTFSITVTDQGSSLQVVEGAVETATSDGGARELIRPGVVAIVSAADRFRLTVQGQDTRTIDSPQRSAPGGAAPTPAEADDAAQIDSDTDGQVAVTTPASVDSAVEIDQVQMITSPITATAADLGKVTNGLVGGSTAVQIASIEAATIRAVIADVRAPTVDDGVANNLDGNASGDNGGNGDGSAAGNDNGNAGGNDNGSAAGNDNGNAGGTDNGNAGGNGNGNAGGSDNGNAGGNGNGNAGGNGNGNAGGNDNGNAGGNGNGNAGGNDNGNAGGNGNGNAGGNDNGNAGGNGNGNAGG
ncbi:FecR family protein, partial [Sphingomonas sp. CCH15-F11]|uniref:FecR family protein n=1 Tax=Sphingomonas sp. CCH15-F11 TaxID=1768785 RepID=UPI0018D25C47